MGWLDRLLGRELPIEVPLDTSLNQPLNLAGDGSFTQEIVGEAFYQKALDRLCGGKTEYGHNKECKASLAPEPENRHDRNAVSVRIGRSLVGYLDQGNAVKFQKEMAKLGATGATAKVDAIIVGGWFRPDAELQEREGHYGVKLDLVWPFERA